MSNQEEWRSRHEALANPKLSIRGVNPAWTLTKSVGVSRSHRITGSSGEDRQGLPSCAGREPPVRTGHLVRWAKRQETTCFSLGLYGVFSGGLHLGHELIALSSGDFSYVTMRLDLHGVANGVGI